MVRASDTGFGSDKRRKGGSMLGEPGPLTAIRAVLLWCQL